MTALRGFHFDAAHVLLFAAHELQGRGDEEARRLLYIAMTRAREELRVSYHRDFALMAELKEIGRGAYRS